MLAPEPAGERGKRAMPMEWRERGKHTWLKPQRGAAAERGQPGHFRLLQRGDGPQNPSLLMGKKRTNFPKIFALGESREAGSASFERAWTAGPER